MNFIKTCFNSFFRTLGRILCYVAIGMILSFLFSKIDVHADMVTPQEIIFNGATYGTYYEIPVVYSSVDLRIQINDRLRYFSTIGTENTNLILDICASGKLNIWRTYAAGSGCSTSCFSQLIQIKQIPNLACRTYTYNDNKAYRIVLPINLWNMSGVTSSELDNISFDDKITLSNSTEHDIYASIYGAYYSSIGFDINNQDALFNDLNQTQQNILNKQNELNQNIKDTNSKLDQAENTRKGIWETIKGIPESVANAIKGLFIPDNFDFLNDFKDTLSNKLGFIAEVPIKLIDFIISLADFSWTEFSSITFPKIEIMGVSFWDDITIDVGPILGGLKKYRYLTDVLCVTLCVNTLRKMYDKFTGGSGE